MQAVEVKSFLEGKLPGTQVEVEGEGCNFQLNVISDGSIHAVTMKFFSSAAWAERT